MLPIAEIGKVISIQSVSTDNYELVVDAPKISNGACAGQFVHVRAENSFNPFLRRPLSIGACVDGTLQLLFTVRGEGTRLLSEKKIGDPVDLIGPLGNGFKIPQENFAKVLIAGGIGVVPLLLLQDRIKYSENDRFYLGVRSVQFLPAMKNDLEKRRVQVASEDGTIGEKGLVTELLAKDLKTMDIGKMEIFACGPEPMLKAIKKICRDHGIPAQISMEVPMGCGIGACQSCAVKRENEEGYLLVCKDGPVFDMNDVDLERGGIK